MNAGDRHKKWKFSDSNYEDFFEKLISLGKTVSTRKRMRSVSHFVLTELMNWKEMERCASHINSETAAVQISIKA